MESTNFSLNDEEFSKIKEISNTVESEVLLLFWQFTIKTLEELDIVSNQHLSIENVFDTFNAFKRYATIKRNQYRSNSIEKKNIYYRK